MDTLMVFHKTLIITFLTVFLQLQCYSQEQPEKLINDTVRIERIKFPVKIDGRIEEDAWKEIKSFSLREIQPEYGGEPSERTEFLLGYDNDYIYAAGRFFNSNPTDLQVTSYKRDNWHYSTDFMALLFDTFNDNENGVMFLASPVGTRTDINILNDFENEANTSWNTFWDVATTRNNECWFTEMRIPFSSLRFEEKDNKVIMGLTVHRWFAKKNEVYSYPLTAQNFGYGGVYKPSQTQNILFEGISRHNPLYITPYLLGGLSQINQMNESGTEYIRNDEFVREAGLDIKFGIAKNLTLDVTINPDFAQVEADNQMVNLTRYSLFYPEKRLFFQERSGNFEFGFEGNDYLFYSRQIGIHEGDKVRIYGGARIVGRAGPWDIGFINMQTEKHEDLLSENFNVMRLRRQVFNPYSYIGGMITSRIGNGENWNSAYGLDGIFRLFGNDYLTLKWAQSFEDGQQNNIADLEPSKIYVNWDRRGTKGFGYDLSYSRSGEYFNPGIGFELIDNYTRFGDRVQFGWYPGEKSKLLNHQVFIKAVAYVRNLDGKTESSILGPGWQFYTKSNSSGSVQLNRNTENVADTFTISTGVEVPAGIYEFYGIAGEYEPLRGKPYRIGTRVAAGSFYDGWHASWSLTPVAYVSAHLQLEGTYQLNRIEFPDRNQSFTGHIGRLKIESFLNVKHSFLAFIQYNSDSDAIFTNLRYRYNPSEGHDLYIVYDEGLNSDRERETPVLPLMKNRTIMLKYSYTFKVGL
jgi:hypothetical protein